MLSHNTYLNGINTNRKQQAKSAAPMTVGDTSTQKGRSQVHWICLDISLSVASPTSKDTTQRGESI